MLNILYSDYGKLLLNVRHSSAQKLSSRRSVDVEFLMVTLKKLQSECLFSDSLWCQDF